MITVERISELRRLCDDARRAGKSVGFVPTMGYFHDGHLTLMREARAHHDLVVVSLFVNPTQFGGGEDLDTYPRDPEGDAAAAEGAGVDILFTPTVEEMYPEGALTSVTVRGVTDDLCGASRPHHFGGVATVVTKLFSIVGPCAAYFGLKDFQQVVVVRRLVADLNLPVEIVGVPIVREVDGLAMSSRNAYLDAEQRQAATVLFRGLTGARKTAEDGEHDPSLIREAALDLLAAEPLVRVDYLELRRAADLAVVERIEPGTAYVIAVAAFVGRTRLIDNVTFTGEH